MVSLPLPTLLSTPIEYPLTSTVYGAALARISIRDTAQPTSIMCCVEWGIDSGTTTHTPSPDAAQPFRRRCSHWMDGMVGWDGMVVVVVL